MILLAALWLCFPFCCHGRPQTSCYMRPQSNELLPHIPENKNCVNPSDGCSDQVHISLGGPYEIIVSFVSKNSVTDSHVYYGEDESLGHVAKGQKTSYSHLLYYNKQLVQPNIGLPETTEEEIRKLQGRDAAEYFTYGSVTNPSEIYHSPVVHQVTLRNLRQGRRYFYRVEGDLRTFSFVMPPRHTPMRIGITADVGQTAVSNATIHALAAMDPDFVLFAGDLSYAEGWGWRWDSFGRLMETAAGRYPFLMCPGNHEMGAGESMMPYNVRWPMPYQRSGSTDNTYWSHSIGLVHIISLNGYTATNEGSLQYEWLLKDLQTIDRSKTPWVVAMMHAPWYNSNTGHQGEAMPMRADMQQVFYDAGVDLVISGHVHAYERTLPVFHDQVDICGPVYLNVGDGGNRGGAYRQWIDPQPDWSAFREASFGAGQLVIHNETHAHFHWKRHACQGDSNPGHLNFQADCTTIGDTSKEAMLTSDETWIIRPKSCANKQFTGNGFHWPDPEEHVRPTSSLTSIALTILFAITSAILLVLFLREKRKMRYLKTASGNEEI